MKTQSQRGLGAGSQAFSLIEVLVVLGVLALVSLLILPRLAMTRRPAYGIMCMNNLKQIGLAFRIYAADNEDRYPTHGWSDGSTWTTSNISPVAVYGMMARELNTPRLLTCPADKRASTTNFNSLGSSNISYFVGISATPDHPQALLGGDRNLMIKGSPLGPGLFPVLTNTALGWSPALHKERGNILLGDGNVSHFHNPHMLRTLVRQQGIATNWLSIP
jgi:prepilin-type N-terminal cleavage/methylation domain-containing protein/prepilin-type processing-associated H-X9-DG protein